MNKQPRKGHRVTNEIKSVFNRKQDYQQSTSKASKLGITRQAVTRMIKRGAIVIDNKIYSPQYEIKND